MIIFSHTPVLLFEAIQSLNIKAGCKYIDATLGGGGHTREILKRGGIVLGIDQDEDAIGFVKQTLYLSIKDGALKVVKGNFRDIGEIAIKNAFEKVDGILLDLGVSSYQLSTSGRGFGIKRDETLDMRMDKNTKLNAYDVVNKYPFERLVEIFYGFGEEHNARTIAEEIVKVRKSSPISTTRRLAQLIEGVSHKSENIHPATRVFQAIRIEVNGEIDALKSVLQQGLTVIRPSGRFVVISFHSLEDRVVKQTFLQFERSGQGRVLNKKPITAKSEEVQKNKRARSAKLRIFEKN